MSLRTGGGTGTSFGPGDPDFLLFDSSTRAQATIANRDRYQKVGRPSRTPRQRQRVVTIPEIPYWEDDPADWDQIVFNPRASNEIIFAGSVEVDGQGPAKKYDKRSAPGSDGARVLDKGYELASLTIKVAIWTSDQLQDYRALMAQILPRRRSSETHPIDVDYPSLAALNISQLTVVRVNPLKRGSVTGTMEFTLECLEYSPPTASPTRAVTAIATNTLASATNALPAPQDIPSTFLPPSSTQTGP